MARQRLYGIFWQDVTRGAMWGLHHNGRTARKIARRVQGLCVSMPLPLPGSAGPWDAPTFRACADRVECDQRQVSK